MNKNSRWPALILLVILLASTLALILQNQVAETFHIFTSTLIISESLANFICLLVGVFICWLLSYALDKRSINVQKQKQWQAQDVKLMASITSDKEKQLEAKIATLEAALKNALKQR